MDICVVYHDSWNVHFPDYAAPDVQMPFIDVQSYITVLMSSITSGNYVI